MAENKGQGTSAGIPSSLGTDAPERSIKNAGEVEGGAVSDRDRQRERVIRERKGLGLSARDALENKRGVERIKLDAKRRLEELQADAKDAGLPPAIADHLEEAILALMQWEG